MQIDAAQGFLAEDIGVRHRIRKTPRPGTAIIIDSYVLYTHQSQRANLYLHTYCRYCIGCLGYLLSSVLTAAISMSCSIPCMLEGMSLPQGSTLRDLSPKHQTPAKLRNPRCRPVISMLTARHVVIVASSILPFLLLNAAHYIFFAQYSTFTCCHSFF